MKIYFDGLRTAMWFVLAMVEKNTTLGWEEVEAKRTQRKSQWNSLIFMGVQAKKVGKTRLEWGEGMRRPDLKRSLHNSLLDEPRLVVLVCRLEHAIKTERGQTEKKRREN